MIRVSEAANGPGDLPHLHTPPEVDVPIRVICPSCSRIAKAPDDIVGRKALCPACQHRYVVTADHVRPGGGPDLDPPPGAKASRAGDARMQDRASIEPSQRPARPPAVAPGPDVEATPARMGGFSPPAPALVGGAVVVILIAALAGWGLGRLGGRPPVAGAPEQDLVAQAPDPATNWKQAVETAPAPSEDASARPGPADATPGEISVAAMLLLDQPPPAESAVVAMARTGAAAVAANDAGRGKVLTTAEIVEESEPSVALIRGHGSSGTGFLVGPGLVATNAHVIDEEFATDLQVQFVSAKEGDNASTRAVLLYEDVERDLAFLAVETKLKPLRVARSYAFRKGEDVTVIGSPGMGNGEVLENAISRGVMSTKAKINEKNFYQLSIAINPGNSGGPVFDSSGRVIGVATLKAAKQEATGFCIPVEDLQAAIAKVGSQTPEDAEKCRSKHRTTAVAKTLGGAGALMCFVIDLRKVDATTHNPEIKELLAKLEPGIDIFEKEGVPTLAVESRLARQDAMLTPTVRNMIGQIADNFEKLRTAVVARNYPGGNQLHNLKQTHRRLITGLSDALKIEFPKEMMVAFEDHAPSQPNFAGTAPPNLGPRFQLRPPGMPPGRLPTLRDRMLQGRIRGR